MFFHTKTIIKSYVLGGVLGAGFLLCGAFYIYGINGATVHAFGKEIEKKELIALEEELRTLEIERAHLAVGSWLEERARYHGLITAGSVHFLSNDMAMVRIDQ